MDPLAADVLRVQGEAEDPVAGMPDLPLDVVPVLGKTIGELPADLQGFFVVADDLKLSEDDHAVEII